MMLLSTPFSRRQLLCYLSESRTAGFHLNYIYFIFYILQIAFIAQGNSTDAVFFSDAVRSITSDASVFFHKLPGFSYFPGLLLGSHLGTLNVFNVEALDRFCWHNTVQLNSTKKAITTNHTFQFICSFLRKYSKQFMLNWCLGSVELMP